MEKPDIDPDFELFKSKKTNIALGLLGLPVYFLFDYFGDPGRGNVAAILSLGFFIVLGLFLKLIRQPWFWVTIAGLICLDILIVLAIPWPDKDYPAPVLLPVLFFDYIFNYGVIKLAGKLTARLNSR